jgi:NADH-quinone oxidoreductase subunit H
LDIGVLFIFAVSGISTIGVLMAGWGSGNKFAMLGGLRGAAQLVSYEIPRVLSVVPVLMFYGTQSLRGIAIAQEARWFGILPKWFVFYPVIGQIAFLIFLIASVAETNRVPFDIPEAESELVAGFHTEFSGLKFALFFLAEYAYVFLASAMATALFLGGGDGFSAGGIIPSWFWFITKTLVLCFCFIWFRWTFPRLRVDRLMQFCWKFLLPWSIANIAFAGLWVLLRT